MFTEGIDSTTSAHPHVGVVDVNRAALASRRKPGLCGVKKEREQSVSSCICLPTRPCKRLLPASASHLHEPRHVARGGLGPVQGARHGKVVPPTAAAARVVRVVRAGAAAGAPGPVLAGGPVVRGVVRRAALACRAAVGAAVVRRVRMPVELAVRMLALQAAAPRKGGRVPPSPSATTRKGWRVSSTTAASGDAHAENLRDAWEPILWDGRGHVYGDRKEDSRDLDAPQERR